MPVRTLVMYPDPRLRQTCRPVEAFDDTVEGLVEDLLETVHAHGGLGLSAPQVGDDRAVLVLCPDGDPSRSREFINPEIVARSAPGLVQESCLSIPGIEGNVIRHTEIRVRAQDRFGGIFETDLSQMDAVSLQHEVDHLEGVLFIDRLNVVRRALLALTGFRRRRSGVPTP